MEPIFLEQEAVKSIHENQITLYGGGLGIRDEALLESALAMPKAAFGGYFLHNDIFEMASAYLYHLVQNHAFIDGNKRVGLATALTFLKINGIAIIVDEDETADMVLQVAQGQVGKDAITDFFRRNVAST